MTIGIERLAVHLPGEAIRVDELARATGLDAAALAAAGFETVAVPAGCEDVVTLAATAADRLLATAGIDPGSLGLLVAASATASRPHARELHQLLELHPHCRLLDVSHGTFSGMAGVTVAADWIRAGGGRRRHALVVTAHAVHGRLAPVPRIGGGVAVAMLVGYEPQAFILLEGGVAAVASRRPGVAPYLSALGDAFLAARAAERPVLEPDEGFTDRLARCLYQTRTPAHAERAHRHVLGLDWAAAAARPGGTGPDALRIACDEQVRPGTAALAAVGPSGPAALWLQLAAILERDGRRLGGRRFGAFGWGGGAGEFVTGLVPAGVGMVADSGFVTALSGRHFLDAAAWTARVAAPGAADPPPGFRGTFLRVGTRRRRRTYARVIPSGS